MTLFGVEPLVPAYGRDYKNDAQVRDALLGGTDFRTAGGQYCSIRDLREMDVQSIQVRYGRGVMGYEQTTVVKLV